MALPPPPPRPPGRKARSWGWLLASAAVLVAFVAGLIVGAAGADPKDSGEYRALEQELAETEDDVRSARAENAELSQAREEAMQQAEEAQEEAASMAAAADARLAELDGREAELDGRVTRLDEREDELDTRASELEDEAAQLEAARSEVEARERAVEDAEVASSHEPASDSSDTYFENCAAARAAGADPVYVGEPGYGGHLDGDGDGVGCE